VGHDGIAFSRIRSVDRVVNDAAGSSTSNLHLRGRNGSRRDAEYWLRNCQVLDYERRYKILTTACPETEFAIGITAPGTDRAAGSCIVNQSQCRMVARDCGDDTADSRNSNRRRMRRYVLTSETELSPPAGRRRRGRR